MTERTDRVIVVSRLAKKSVTLSREICSRSECDKVNRLDAKSNLDSSECYKKYEKSNLV